MSRDPAHLVIYGVQHDVLLLQALPHGFPDALQRSYALLNVVQRLVLLRLGHLPVLNSTPQHDLCDCAGGGHP